MAIAAFNTARRFTISEPLKAAWEHGNQLFIAGAAAFMSAGFSMQHGALPWWLAVLLAVGFEWTYLRGLANADKVGKTRWAQALNVAAMVTSCVYSMLYILGLFKVIPVEPSGWTALWLATAHAIPMTVLSFARRTSAGFRSWRRLRATGNWLRTQTSATGVRRMPQPSCASKWRVRRQSWSYI